MRYVLLSSAVCLIAYMAPTMLFANTEHGSGVIQAAFYQGGLSSENGAGGFVPPRPQNAWPSTSQSQPLSWLSFYEGSVRYENPLFRKIEAFLERERSILSVLRNIKNIFTRREASSICSGDISAVQDDIKTANRAVDILESMLRHSLFTTEVERKKLEKKLDTLIASGTIQKAADFKALKEEFSSLKQASTSCEYVGL